MFSTSRAKQNDHLSFGEGIHYCLGAPLARLEAGLAFGMMLNRFPRLRARRGTEAGLQDLVLRAQFEVSPYGGRLASTPIRAANDAAQALRAVPIMHEIPLR